MGNSCRNATVHTETVYKCLACNGSGLAFKKNRSVWGLYNFDRLMGIELTRRKAIAAIEQLTGEPWRKAKDYMDIRKVIVTKIA